jgi:exodeoxyribonuclease VII large subunit
VIWAFAPVQDRHAAPAIAAALQDLAARPEVEAIVVTRGGGSLADLWAFCDETLCRTVALLRVPVISAVGHERDSTLIDDVAAIACSTPTHAAEAVVPLDCLAARESLQRCAIALRRAGEGAIGARSRHLGALARGPARALQRERSTLNQKIREIRAASERGLTERSGFQRRIGTVVLERARRRAAEEATAALAAQGARGGALERSAERTLRRRREALRQATVALRAHDPERALERGYALAEGPGGEPLTSAAGAVAAGAVKLRFSDGRVRAKVEEGIERDA